MGKNIKSIFIAVILILAAAAGGFWYWQRQKKVSETPPAEPPGLGAQIFESTRNPLKEKLPDTNPFSADTNPFDATTNPFERSNPLKSIYTNPFE